jgi:hypothetical protein
MKKVLGLAACVSVLAVAALANEPLPYLTATPGGMAGSGNSYDKGLVDNLVTSGSQITNGLAGCAYFSSWVAFDYTPSMNITVGLIVLDYVYNSSPLKNTINFRLYQGTNPGSGSTVLVRSWDVPAASYNEVNTGWVAFNRPVYRSTIFIPSQALTAYNKYWFAYTSPNSAPANIVYWAVQATLKGEQVWWYLSGRWGSGSSQGAGGTYDQSYSLDWLYMGVAPTSFGKVKALFN